MKYTKKNISEFFEKEKDKRSSKAASILILVVASIFILLVIFANPLLNNFVIDEISNSVNQDSTLKFNAGNVKLNLLTGSISSYNSDLQIQNAEKDTIILNMPYIKIDQVNWAKLISGNYYAEKITIKDPEVFWKNFSFTDSTEKEIDSVSRERSDKSLYDDLNESLAQAFPEKINSININKLILINGNYKKFAMPDSAFLLSSLENLDLNISEISLNKNENILVSGINLSVKNPMLKFPESGYELKFDSLKISSFDSLISGKNFSFQPYISQNDFFEMRKFRANKYDINFDSVKFSGLNFNDVLRKNLISAKDLFIKSASFEIISNKIKPIDPDSDPKMPNEFFNSFKFDVKIPEVKFSGGSIKYGELFEHHEDPAILNFTNLNASLSNFSNIKNEKEPANILNASAKLADAGKLDVLMNLNLTDENLNLTYKGKLSAMELNSLNDFLKISSAVEIESGKINEVTFDVKVNNGIAEGIVKPVYENLNIDLVSEDLEKNFNLKRFFKTFVANEFMIEKSNPNGDNEIKTGKVEFTHNGEAFFEFIWLALREALAETIGLK